MSDYLPEIFLLIRKQIVEKQNPLGIPPDACAEWCKNLEIPEHTDTILYSGCLWTITGIIERLDFAIRRVAKDPTSDIGVKILGKFINVGKKLTVKFRNEIYESIPVKAVEILKQLKYNVSCLKEEPYSGALLHDLGFYDNLIRYGETLRDFFRQHGVKRIILLDPHTYDLFINIYSKEVDDFDFEIINFLELLNELIEKERLELRWDEEIIVTYHDPCHYSRATDKKIIDEPRNILTSIKNVKLREPYNTKNLSICCGAPLEFTFYDLSKEIAKIRYQELMKTEATYIITACPLCFINLRRVAGERKEAIKDIIDFVHSSIKRG